MVVDKNSCCLNVTTDNVQEDPSKTTKFTVLTDSNLSISAQTLNLNKTYTTYKINKSYHGQIISIEIDDVKEESDVITIPNGYAYGNATSFAKNRESTKNQPNFYGE